jgi:ABC-type multidrug transport system permease subunit
MASEAKGKVSVELIAFVVVALLLLATCYFFVVAVTQQSIEARIAGLILALVTLYALGKWLYPGR